MLEFSGMSDEIENNSIELGEPDTSHDERGDGWVGFFLNCFVTAYSAGVESACEAQRDMIEEEEQRVIRKYSELRDPYGYDPNDPCP